MDAKKSRGVGKSDALDAHRIAMAVLPLPVDKLRRPRLHDGVRQRRADPGHGAGIHEQDRTRSVNALNALVRGNDLGIDARKKLNRRPDHGNLKVAFPRGRAFLVHRPCRGRAAGQTRPGTG